MFFEKQQKTKTPTKKWRKKNTFQQKRTTSRIKRRNKKNKEDDRILSNKKENPLKVKKEKHIFIKGEIPKFYVNLWNDMNFRTFEIEKLLISKKKK